MPSVEVIMDLFLILALVTFKTTVLLPHSSTMLDYDSLTVSSPLHLAVRGIVDVTSCRLGIRHSRDLLWGQRIMIVGQHVHQRVQLFSPFEAESFPLFRAPDE